MTDQPINLTQFSILRPDKIAWRFPAGLEDPLTGIKSKTLRNFLRTSEEVLTANQIEYTYGPVSRSEFEEWLVYYEAKMKENGYRVLANMEWYDTRVDKGITIEGVFMKQKGVLVCSGIFTRTGQEKATFAFKAGERLNLSNKENSSVGAVVDFLFLKIMSQEKMAIISAGKSRNAFGVHNTFGYLDYKLRFGYMPFVTENTEMLSEVPTNDLGQVLFFGLQDGQLCLFALKKTDDPTRFEAARFNSPDLPFIELTY